MKELTWADFFEEIFEKRILRFFQQPISVFYLVCIIGIVGSAGVWLPIILAKSSDPCFDFKDNLAIGLATYCITLLAATMADQILQVEDSNRSVRFFSYALVLVCILLVLVVIIQKNICLALCITFFAYFLWIITYSMDPAKQDQTIEDPSAPKGGNTEIVLQGSVEGFKDN